MIASWVNPVIPFYHPFPGSVGRLSPLMTCLVWITVCPGPLGFPLHILSLIFPVQVILDYCKRLPRIQYQPIDNEIVIYVQSKGKVTYIWDVQICKYLIRRVRESVSCFSVIKGEKNGLARWNMGLKEVLLLQSAIFLSPKLARIIGALVQEPYHIAL